MSWFFYTMCSVNELLMLRSFPTLVHPSRSLIDYYICLVLFLQRGLTINLSIIQIISNYCLFLTLLIFRSTLTCPHDRVHNYLFCTGKFNPYWHGLNVGRLWCRRENPVRARGPGQISRFLLIVSSSFLCRTNYFCWCSPHEKRQGRDYPSFRERPFPPHTSGVCRCVGVRVQFVYLTL